MCPASGSGAHRPVSLQMVRLRGLRKPAPQPESETRLGPGPANPQCRGAGWHTSWPIQGAGSSNSPDSLSQLDIRKALPPPPPGASLGFSRRSETHRNGQRWGQLLIRPHGLPTATSLPSTLPWHLRARAAFYHHTQPLSSYHWNHLCIPSTSKSDCRVPQGLESPGDRPVH